MGGFGLTEILIVLFIVILLFGGKKIPEIAKGLGEGIRGFKKSIKEDDSDKDEKKESNKLDDK